MDITTPGDTAASRVYNITMPRSRPTALLPFWHVAGYALGAGTALLGKEAAMACTVAVEVGLPALLPVFREK